MNEKTTATINTTQSRPIPAKKTEKIINYYNCAKIGSQTVHTITTTTSIGTLPYNNSKKLQLHKLFY